MKHSTVAILASALLTACGSPTVTTPGILAAAGTSGRPIDMARVKQIRIGHTTEAQLIAMFGSPITTTRLGQGQSMLTWFHSVGGSATTLSTPVVSATQLKMQVLSVHLSPAGTVEFYSFSGDSPTPVTGGAIVQRPATYSGGQ
jgi:hypothetical protein